MSTKTLLILKTYWQHASKYPGYLLGLAITVPIGLLGLRLIPPLIAAEVIRRLASHDYVDGQFWASFGQQIVLFAVITVIGGVIAMRIVIYLVWKLETYVNRDLLRSMFNHYVELDAAFHSDSFSGSLVSRANKLVVSYIRLADAFVFQLSNLVISFVFVMVLMYPKAPLFVWAFLVFATLFIFTSYMMSRRVRVLSVEEANAENRNTGSLADAITNVMAIKSYATASHERKQFERVTEETRLIAMRVMWATINRDFVASVITSSIAIMALLVAVIAIVDHNSNLATVFLMLTYTAYLADKLWEFQSSTLRNFNRSIGDAYEAVKILDTKPKIQDPEIPEGVRIHRGSIVFKNVGFRHDQNSSKLFHNLNLNIKQGEKIGLVGPSGGGKTTLTKLLMRYMDINGGEILIDGQNIADIRQSDLREHISYVPQEPLLFHRSLRENIGYGQLDAKDEVIEGVAKMAHADEFIKGLPQGYNTLVGERGVKLSGGQRQRVVIARAMLKNAPILVLDEATSALDSESEVLIQDALWKLMERRTAIVIAHRLSTIQKMDRIIVLEDGKIAEQGSHKELLRNNGTYAKLWAHQSGGFIEE